MDGEVEATPEDIPVEVEATPEDIPAEVETTPEDIPAEVETTPEDKPAEVETTPEDKPVELDDILNCHDEYEKVKFARMLMGDAWIEKTYQQHPDSLVSELAEKQKSLKDKFVEVNRRKQAED